MNNSTCCHDGKATEKNKSSRDYLKQLYNQLPDIPNVTDLLS
jgi:hypothetical protein